MIEKITDNKYLYQGRVVDLAFLQARKAELEQMIKDNEAQITAIELIDTEDLSGAMKEAAELWNSEKTHFVDSIRLVSYTFKNEIKLISSVCR
jgi:hypothetical protein